MVGARDRLEAQHHVGAEGTVQILSRCIADGTDAIDHRLAAGGMIHAPGCGPPPGEHLERSATGSNIGSSSCVQERDQI